MACNDDKTIDAILELCARTGASERQAIIKVTGEDPPPRRLQTKLAQRRAEFDLGARARERIAVAHVAANPAWLHVGERHATFFLRYPTDGEHGRYAVIGVARNLDFFLADSGFRCAPSSWRSMGRGDDYLAMTDREFDHALAMLSLGAEDHQAVGRLVRGDPAGDLKDDEFAFDLLCRLGLARRAAASPLHRNGGHSEIVRTLAADLVARWKRDAVAAEGFDDAQLMTEALRRTMDRLDVAGFDVVARHWTADVSAMVSNFSDGYGGRRGLCEEIRRCFADERRAATLASARPKGAAKTAAPISAEAAFDHRVSMADAAAFAGPDDGPLGFKAVLAAWVDAQPVKSDFVKRIAVLAAGDLDPELYTDVYVAQRLMPLFVRDFTVPEHLENPLQTAQRLLASIDPAELARELGEMFAPFAAEPVSGG